MRITAFDVLGPVNIESLSAVHDKPCTVRKSPYLAGFEPSSLACKANCGGYKHYSASLFSFDYTVMLKKTITDYSALKIAP